MRATFDIAKPEENKEIDNPDISSSWKRQEVLMKFDKKIEHYKYKSKDKAATFSYLREQLATYKGSENNPPDFKFWLEEELDKPPVENISHDLVEDDKEQSSLINKKSSFFKKSETRTCKQILGENRNAFCNEKGAKKIKALRFINKLKNNDDYVSMLKN